MISDLIKKLAALEIERENARLTLNIVTILTENEEVRLAVYNEMYAPKSPEASTSPVSRRTHHAEYVGLQAEILRRMHRVLSSFGIVTLQSLSTDLNKPFKKVRKSVNSSVREGLVVKLEDRLLLSEAGRELAQYFIDNPKARKHTWAQSSRTSLASAPVQ